MWLRSSPRSRLCTSQSPAVTDPGYREEFFEEVVGDVRQAFAVRAVYLRLVDEAGGDQPKR